MNREVAEEWLKSASSDLETISEIIGNGNLTHVVAFHSQQCIEKSLKALLEWQGKEVPKTHSIVRLAFLLRDKIRIDGDLADELDKLYINSRYPGDMGLLPEGKPSVSKAGEFYEAARGLYARIKTEILLET
jgi:HEPN domain-containing protein